MQPSTVRQLGILARSQPYDLGRSAVDDLDALATLLDSAVRIPGLGVKVGLDAVLGLIPGVGDAASSLASLYILSRAHRMGVGRATLSRMGLNIAADLVVGAIPAGRRHF